MYQSRDRAALGPQRRLPPDTRQRRLGGLCGQVSSRRGDAEDGPVPLARKVRMMQARASIEHYLGPRRMMVRGQAPAGQATPHLGHELSTGQG